MRVLGVAQDASWSQSAIWQERLPFYGFELHETIKSQLVCLMGFFADGSEGSTFFGSGLSGLGLNKEAPILPSPVFNSTSIVYP